MSSVLLLVLLFGLYGVVYLLRFAGVLSAQTEHLLYTFMGFSCKASRLPKGSSKAL